MSRNNPHAHGCRLPATFPSSYSSAANDLRDREGDMTLSRRIAAAMAAALGVLCAAPSTLAGESGSFSAIATYVRDFTTVEHADGTYFGGSLEGSTTVLASSGDPFAAGGHSLSTCVVFGKRSAAGLDLKTACTTVNASGDTLYLVAERRAGDVEAGGGGEGELELMGGTGVYAGLGGRCAYQTEYLANNQVITTTDCTWHRD